MKPLVVAAIALSLCCGATTPVHFAKGTNWTLPLVGPLENDRLVVPAFIHGKGPYLFILDPDAVISMIDRSVAQSLKLFSRPNAWSGFVDHRDREVRRRAYEVLRFSSGDLEIRNKVMFGAPAGSLTFRGQHVHGVLGRDLLTRTITLDVDRDRGVVRLALTGHEAQLRNSDTVQGRVHKERSSPHRKIVMPVRINDRATATLAVDLAARTSAVWPKFLRRAGVAMGPGSEVVVDGLGSPQTIRGRGQASLAFGAQKIDAALIPFNDGRVWEPDYHGVIGQNVLSRYRVLYNPDKRRVSLVTRDADLGLGAGARVRRWGRAFARCPSRGCVEVSVQRDPHKGLIGLSVARTQGAPQPSFEVVLEPLDAAGQPLPLPVVRISLQPKTSAAVGPAVLAQLRTAVDFRVIDASPFAPRCRGGECAVLLPRPRLTNALRKPGPPGAGLIITNRHVYGAAAAY